MYKIFDNYVCFSKYFLFGNALKYIFIFKNYF